MLWHMWSELVASLDTKAGFFWLGVIVMWLAITRERITRR